MLAAAAQGQPADAQAAAGAACAAPPAQPAAAPPPPSVEQQQEALLRAKYGGLMPKKLGLLAQSGRKAEPAHFDSADWALSKARRGGRTLRDVVGGGGDHAATHASVSVLPPLLTLAPAQGRPGPAAAAAPAEGGAAGGDVAGAAAAAAPSATAAVLGGGSGPGPS